MRIPFVLIAAALILAGCQGRAVIADLEEDKVIVQHNTAAEEDGTLMRTAREGCRVHGRTPVAISSSCLDNYCINKRSLFACKE